MLQLMELGQEHLFDHWPAPGTYKYTTPRVLLRLSKIHRTLTEMR